MDILYYPPGAIVEYKGEEYRVLRRDYRSGLYTLHRPPMVTSQTGVHISHVSPWPAVFREADALVGGLGNLFLKYDAVLCGYDSPMLYTIENVFVYEWSSGEHTIGYSLQNVGTGTFGWSFHESLRRPVDTEVIVITDYGLWGGFA